MNHVLFGRVLFNVLLKKITNLDTGKFEFTTELFGSNSIVIFLLKKNASYKFS